MMFVFIGERKGYRGGSEKVNGQGEAMGISQFHKAHTKSGRRGASPGVKKSISYLWLLTKANKKKKITEKDLMATENNQETTKLNSSGLDREEEEENGKK